MPGLAGEVANLVVALKLDDSGFSGRLNAAARSLRNMDSGLSQVGRGVGQVGTGLGKIATVGAVAAVGGLTAVITTAASMEEAFTGVQKTVDETADVSFEELRRTIRQMSSESGTAFEELARIGELGGALGVDISSLDEFIDVVNRLGVSTDLSVDAAATALGQLGTILDLEGEELRDFADVLVALGNAGASTEPQIVEMAARFAAAGNQAGLSEAEILALSSAVSSMGIEVESGGSSLSRLFNQTTTNIATANEEAHTFADALGLTFDQFREAWDKDALGTFEDLLGHLGELDQFEAASLLDQLGITNVRDVNALLLMSQNLDDVNAALETAEGATGALNEESDKFFGTSARGFARLKENVRLTADTIGTELLPVTNELIGEFIGFLQQPDTQAGIKSFAEDLADGVRGFVAEARKIDWDPIIGGLQFAGTVAKGVLDLFKSLPAPLQGLIVGGLALNKISGGALTDILKGVGNIAVGGAKLFGNRGATPANPLFVKEVGIPGTGGPGGGGGRGIPAVVGGAVAVAGGALIGGQIGGAIIEEWIKPARDFMDAQVEAIIDSNDPDRIRAAVAALDKEIAFWNDKPPQVRAAMDAVIDTLEERRDALAASVPDRPPGGGGGPAGTTGTSEWARGLEGVKQVLETGTSSWASGLSGLEAEVAQLPDTAMLQSQVSRIVAELPPIRTAAQQQLAAQYADLSAVREVGGAVRGMHGTLAAKDFSPNVIVPVNVNISTTMFAQQVARVSTSRQGATSQPRLE